MMMIFKRNSLKIELTSFLESYDRVTIDTDVLIYLRDCEILSQKKFSQAYILMVLIVDRIS